MTGVDGTAYRGSWVDNMREGKGKITYPNGESYNGHWKANMVTKKEFFIHHNTQ